MESLVNKTFDELLWMPEEEFRQWAIDLREEVVRLWDEKGQPPRVGFDKDEIIEQFRELEGCIAQQYERVDEYTGERNLFRCTTNLGNAVNQFFPTMMRTKINYSKDPSLGKSIYDYFARPDLLDSFLIYANRHFKRDSFYNYSRSVHANNVDEFRHLPIAENGVQWISKFEEGNYRTRTNWDYWLAPEKGDEGYTGFKEELRATKNLRLTQHEIEELGGTIPDKCKTNVNWEKSEVYSIRVFELGQKIFPIGLKCFRVSFCQYAVNFPPVAAKYVYEKYTQQWKDESNIVVWDPSAGWGGRLLGALAVEDSRHLTYLGNDPNTDHNTTPGRTKYHEIADFYREHVRKGGMWQIEHNGFEFWQKGSEDMQYDPDFQKYKGKISLVFTSPPYFSKEAYSEDKEQSYLKFSQYEQWRDGFLKETLRTAVEWLRPGGYIIWNIANVEFGTSVLPLETDSRTFLDAFEMQYVETIKMALAQMPGSHRVHEDTGLPKTKNFCKDNGLWLKFEPLFVYRKAT
jgi:hypothetical protein